MNLTSPLSRLTRLWMPPEEGAVVFDVEPLNADFEILLTAGRDIERARLLDETADACGTLLLVVDIRVVVAPLLPVDKLICPKLLVE